MAFVLCRGYLKPLGFIGLCCSDGVKDHFSLAHVRGCNTAGEIVLLSMCSLVFVYGFGVGIREESKAKWTHLINMVSVLQCLILIDLKS